MNDFVPESIYQQLVQVGEDWADKEAAADLLEETKKSVLAELKREFSGSDAERERNALADPAYKLHVTKMNAARREANRARVKYDSCKVLAELRRTQESTRRMERYQQ